MFVLLIFGLIFAATVSTVVEADTAVAGRTDWQVAYWNNPSLTGEPVATTTAETISYAWGQGAPEGIQADGFSGRWSTSIYLAGGNYQFVSESDEGVRVWVDDELVIDDWGPHARSKAVVTRTLQTGLHDFVVEYYDLAGDALLTFSLQAVEQEEAVPALPVDNEASNEARTTTTTTTVQSGVCEDVYVVQAGDWLSTIAQQCDVSLAEILAANPQIENPNLIYVGQEVNIPR